MWFMSHVMFTIICNLVVRFRLNHVSDANATLEIMHAAYTRDTGAYKCKARNAAGSSQDIATVFIEKSDVPPYTASCKWS